MNAFALQAFFRAVASGRLDIADPDVRALMREIHGSRGDVRLRRRDFPMRAVRLRSSDGGRVSGVASTYGVSYEIGWGTLEQIEAGAFADSIRERPSVPLFGAHDWDEPIGVATLTDTPSALRFDGELFIAENERARSYFLAAQKGALDGVSVGFYPKTIETDVNERPPVDHITSADLAEVSLVVRGANPSARLDRVA